MVGAPVGAVDVLFCGATEVRSGDFAVGKPPFVAAVVLGLAGVAGCCLSVGAVGIGVGGFVAGATRAAVVRTGVSGDCADWGVLLVGAVLLGTVAGAIRGAAGLDVGICPEAGIAAFASG